MRYFKKFPHLFLNLIVFSLPFAVYFLTLSSTVAPGDSTEMVTAAYLLGVPHQPSYPVSTLIGHLFSRLPLPLPVVTRINLTSAFLHALTILLLYRLILKLYHNLAAKPLSLFLRLLAFASSMFMAFSLTFWQYSTKFEVFPLNNLFAVGLLLFAFSIKASGSLPRIKLMALLFFAGLAFSHHQTIVLIFPALAALLYPKFTALGSKRLLLKKSFPFLFAFLIGLFPFFGLLLFFSSRRPLLNWGDIREMGDAFSALLRTDYGTFSSYLEGFEKGVRPYPFDQLVFYLKNIVSDFTLLGFALFLFGLYASWKLSKKLSLYLFAGLLFAGPVFLSYANFPINDSFNQATARRFHLLPGIFVTQIIALALFYIYTRFLRFSPSNFHQKLSLLLSRIVLVFSFLFLIFINFSKANHRSVNLTEMYVRHAYSYLPANALVLLSGDIPNMTADYYRYVVLGGKTDIISFTPGQFHLDWFTPQLYSRYPALVIPEPAGSKMFTTTTQLVDANYSRWPVYVGPDLVVHDPDLEEKYVLYPKHLLFLVKKRGEDINLESWREENDAIWAELDQDQSRAIQKNSPNFEQTIIFHYLRHFYNVGYIYEEVSLHDDAIREYKRVLELDPYFKDALAALGRIYGEKLENPDYTLAIDYLQKYQSLVTKDEYELGQAAQGMIEKYREKLNNELNQP